MCLHHLKNHQEVEYWEDYFSVQMLVQTNLMFCNLLNWIAFQHDFSFDNNVEHEPEECEMNFFLKKP